MQWRDFYHGRGEEETGRLGDWEDGETGENGRQGDWETGDWETGRLGDRETGRWGDRDNWETGRRGDWEIRETGRQGDRRQETGDGETGRQGDGENLATAFFLSIYGTNLQQVKKQRNMYLAEVLPGIPALIRVCPFQKFICRNGWNFIRRSTLKQPR